MAEASPAAKVRLEISFKDAGQRKRFPEEEVTGVTARGYEIVEAAGLVFRRRSKSLRTAAAPTPAASTPAAAPVPQANAADAAPADNAADAEMEVEATAAAQPSQTPAQAAASQQQPAGQQEPVALSPDRPSSADEQQQAQEALAAVPEAVQESGRLTAVCTRVAEAALASAQLGEGEQAQRIASSLQAVLERFRDGVEGALQESTLVCEEQQQAAPAEAAGTSERERAAMEGRLRSYKTEEAAWVAALEQSSAALQQQAAAVPAQAASPQAAEPAADLPSLEGARTAVHQKMAFQVECLCSMIATVEEMVALAELQCGEMQAEYHREKFRAFPHVDSPARLIHEIVRARARFQAVPMRAG